MKFENLHPGTISTEWVKQITTPDLADLAEHLNTTKWKVQWGNRELLSFVVPEMGNRLRSTGYTEMGNRDIVEEDIDW
jgi:hypothetical protein